MIMIEGKLTDGPKKLETGLVAETFNQQTLSLLIDKEKKNGIQNRTPDQT